MKFAKLITLAALSLPFANPAFAAKDKPFFSLANTDFIVLLGFLLFIAILIYYKVPAMLAGMLDKRAEGIQNELDEARSLREEAQTLLASYERKQKEVQEQADRIVEAAKREAETAAEVARADLAKSLERRMAAAEEQIQSAQAAAVKEVRDQSVMIAVAAAREVIAKELSAAEANALINSSIETVKAKLH